MSELYFAAEGFAWTKGVDNFSSVMPRERFNKLYQATINTRGRRWADIHFLNWVTNIAVRTERGQNAKAAV